MFGFALTNPHADGNGEGMVSISRATSDHSNKSQRWVIHYYQDEESGVFTVSSALDGRWIGPFGRLLPASQANNAAPLQFNFLGNGDGYTVKFANNAQGKIIGISDSGSLSTGSQQWFHGFSIWSVTYHD
jgi:phospholipase C